MAMRSYCDNITSELHLVLSQRCGGVGTAGSGMRRMLPRPHTTKAVIDSYRQLLTTSVIDQGRRAVRAIRQNRYRPLPVRAVDEGRHRRHTDTNATAVTNGNGVAVLVRRVRLGVKVDVEAHAVAIAPLLLPAAFHLACQVWG